MQTIRWANIKFEGREDAEVEASTVLVCSDIIKDDETQEETELGCGALIEEAEKLSMMLAGEWRARYPDRRVRGYHLNALYSPWRRWSEVVLEFLRCKGSRELLQTWVNTELGEPFEDAGETVDTNLLAARREKYPAQVPGMAGVITGGVDVQGDRLELLLVGWGAREESWLLEHHMIFGDPDDEEVWDELDDLLKADYEHESGHTLRVRACGIDHGGHHAKAVEKYVRGKTRRRIFQLQGMDGEGRAPVSRPKRVRGKSRKVPLILVGTHPLKDAIYARLRSHKFVPGEVNPRFVHLPDSIDEEGIRQLTAEVVRTKFSHGRPKRYYDLPKGQRNEMLDLLVYAMAALHFLGPAVQRNLKKYVDELWKKPKPKKKAPALSAAEVKSELRGKKRPKRRGKGWTNRY